MTRRRAFPVLVVLAAVAAPVRPEPALPDLPPLPDPLSGRILPERAERLVWNKIPLHIVLPVGRERLVTFPSAVRVGLPPELGAETLRTQIVDGTVYWTALRAFRAQRIQVQVQASGNVYLIDVAAAPSGSATPVEVALPERPAGPVQTVPGVQAGVAGSPAPPREPPQPPEPDYAALIRMASQQLYGPARLHRVPEGVRRAPVAGETTAFLLRGGAVEATPVAAWRAGSLHLTAVRLRNRTYGAAALDPRRLRGGWLAAAFQHARLAARGDLQDTTALYLVSDRPYAEALDGR